MRRSKNLTGGDIVDKLVEGSATFEEKTGFSKAKYIRKKMKKHVFTVRCMRARVGSSVWMRRGGCIAICCCC